MLSKKLRTFAKIVLKSSFEFLDIPGRKTALVIYLCKNVARRERRRGSKLGSSIQIGNLELPAKVQLIPQQVPDLG